MATVNSARAAAIAALCWVLLASSSPAWSAAPPSDLQPIPPLAAHVTDLTGTLRPDEVTALDQKLSAWEGSTGNQLAVLIVRTTKPEAIEPFSMRVAEAWKLGQKGKDNGVLFLVAKDDKKMRIEVGYGLEGVLPDVTARRIIGDVVAPKFEQGQFAEGISAGAERIMSVASGEVIEPRPVTPAGRSGRGFGGLENLLVLLLVGVPVVGGVLRRMFGKFGGSLIGAGVIGGATWLFASSIFLAAIAGIVAFIITLFSGGAGRSLGGLPGAGGWGGTSGGSWGGGSSGGWSGGGGGGFGGGGASGGWK